MPRRLTTLAIAIMGLAVSHAALAELYISPVLRDTVTYNHADAAKPKPATTAPAAAAKAQPVAQPSSTASVIRGNSSVHGAFEMKAKPKEGSLFGKNVPLFVAMENLVPNSKSWTFVFQPGTENVSVSWKGATTWRDAVTQISKNHSLVIAINEPAKRISVARTANMAKQLAQPGQNVWVLETDKSLRMNLEAWAKKAGWTISRGDTQIDYPIDHSATLVGKFAGRGGVVDRVLSATQGRETPLTAKFYHGNKVVVLQEAGYKPEVPVTPVIDSESY